MTKPEPPEAFVNRIQREATDDDYELDEDAVIEMVRARDAARDERIAELHFTAKSLSDAVYSYDSEIVSLKQRIASLESQLATARAEAREAALREAIGAVSSLPPQLPTGQGIDAQVAAERTADLYSYEAVRAIQKLRASPPPRVDGWIPVSERLPPTNGHGFGFSDTVLVAVRCDNGVEFVSTDKSDCDGAEPWCNHLGRQGRHVTHWMPLPAPPSPKDPSNG